MAYNIAPLDRTEFETLAWLADRGYDGGIMNNTSGYWNDEETVYTFESIPENKAWAIKDAIDADWNSFMSCNGSRSLAEKLNAFIESIV